MPWTILRCLAAALPLLLASPRGARAAEVIEHPFRVTADAAFQPVEATLRTLLHGRRPGGANHFCVIGQRLEDGNRQAWILWREGRALILWEPAAEGIADLRRSRRSLRLGRDVVPDGDPRLASSTYLTGRGWYRDLARQCRLAGEAFTLR